MVKYLLKFILFVGKNHLLLLLLTFLSLTTSLPRHHTISSKYPHRSPEDESNPPPEDDYENPYQIFSDDPSEYYSSGGEMASDPPPVYGVEEPPDDESQGTTTEGFDYELKDDDFDHDEDEDEMENRDRRDLLRGQRQQARPNERCSKLNGQIKCFKRRHVLGPSNKQVLRTSRSFVYPFQRKREVAKNTGENKEWKSFRNKEELFNYIEDIVLKPNLPPDESTTKPGKKNKKAKSTTNPSTTGPTVKVGPTDPQNLQNSWLNFQKWMRDQLDQPERRLEFESQFTKNQNRRDNIPTLGELSNKEKGKRFEEVANITTQVPIIVETPFVFLDNPAQKVERYEFGPTKYTVETKDMFFDKIIEQPAKASVFPDIDRDPVTSKGVAEDVKQLQIPSMNYSITAEGNTKKEFKTFKTTPNPVQYEKAQLHAPDRGKDNSANRKPEKNVIQSMFNKNGFLFTDMGGNQSENNQLSKEKVFEYKFKVSSIEDQLIIPDPSKYGALFFNSTINIRNSTKHPYNYLYVYNATPTMEDVFSSVLPSTEPAEFLPRADSYSETTEPPYSTTELNKNGSIRQLDMVIKLPENALKEMEDSMRKRNRVVMKLDFERPDLTLIEKYNATSEGVSTIKPNVTTIDVPNTSTGSKLEDTDLYPDETSPSSFSGQDGINMMKFAVKLTENMQESVNRRSDLTEAEKVLLYNIILQKFMKLLSIDIDLMSKNK